MQGEMVNKETMWQFRAKKVCVTTSPVILADRLYFGDPSGFFLLFESVHGGTNLADFSQKPLLKYLQYLQETSFTLGHPMAGYTQ
ncbi:MAG: hypothetical protein Ct9H300mP11_28800 [Chloroflexota bacterium]|nr:MAG: hypothetical protein Ct9H300mP11_28800 [Chloroflexota bacterium]